VNLLNEIYGEWGFAIRIALIIVGLVVLRWILLVAIKRVVTTVTTGVKKREGAADTKALDASPLARARIVQRARTIGLVLSNLLTAGLTISALIAILSEFGIAIGALAAMETADPAQIQQQASVIQDQIKEIYQLPGLTELEKA
jgi:small conductance mechanosensitive channel